jgi:hypothetical protein
MLTILLSAADPRVDSDLDGSRHTGTTGTTGHTTHSTGVTGTGTGYGSTNAGPHSVSFLYLSLKRRSRFQP